MAIKRKKYVISKRFTIWLEKTVMASDLPEALEDARTAGYADFLEAVDESVEVVDSEEVSGTGVREDW
jgi:hypothetical protein